ncbi:MAG: DUF5060 domain-containing protein, partial [Planctomycetota bacterium JB042]
VFADDVWSARWTGWLNVPAAGAWTFTTTSNDGVRLWIDGDLVIEDWTTHAAKDDAATVTFAGPGWVPVWLEHFNELGAATIRLFFQGPGQPKAIVPSTHLSSTDPNNAGPAVDAGTTAKVLAPATSATLVGSAIDPDGIATVLWTQTAGPAAAIGSPNALTTTVTLSGLGRHEFELTCTDALGGVGKDRVAVVAVDGSSGGVVTGEARVWHPLTVTFTHDQVLNEAAPDIPFRNYRMQVAFVHSATGTTYDVPGFFAADGNAADTSAQAGTKWRVRFTPDRAGEWCWVASFRNAPDVAIDLDPNAGTPLSFDGGGGSVVVQPTDPAAPGFRRKGRLEWDGTHHLRFAGTHERFLKGGADSPENLLGYHEFDQTFDTGGVFNDLNLGPHGDGLHHFDPHAGDFVPGDPTWLGGGTTPKGQNLIGALNYLASTGANSIYFLTYNIDGGDGREVWPWGSPLVKYRFDVSKLAQWEVVLDHAERLGLALNVITQEQENDQGIDGGGLGVARKLYYRELVARFGHHLALVWNLGEENTNTNLQRQQFAEYLRAVDPYDHPITSHTFPSDLNTVYTPLLGFEAFEGPSMQVLPNSVHADTLKWTSLSADAGRPWFVCNDEQVPANDGVLPDANDPNHDVIRKQALWGNLMGLGSGCEWYFGYAFPHADLDCEDWRSRANMWAQTFLATDFFQRELPFWEMEPADGLTPDANDFVLAKKGFVYAVYRPQGGATTLDLQASADTYTVRWFPAKIGGPLQTGAVSTITGPGVQSIGAPPTGGDWCAVIRRQANLPPQVIDAFLETEPFVGPSDFVLRVHATDPIGPVGVDRVEVHVEAPNGQYVGVVPLAYDGGTSWSLRVPNVPALPSGTWTFYAAAFDPAGAFDYVVRTFEAP